jgi:hypothetical protein
MHDTEFHSVLVSFIILHNVLLNNIYGTVMRCPLSEVHLMYTAFYELALLSSAVIKLLAISLLYLTCSMLLAVVGFDCNAANSQKYRVCTHTDRVFQNIWSRFNFIYECLPDYIEKNTVFGISEFSRLRRLCCPWCQFHETLVIKFT